MTSPLKKRILLKKLYCTSYFCSKNTAKKERAREKLDSMATSAHLKGIFLKFSQGAVRPPSSNNRRSVKCTVVKFKIRMQAGGNKI
jgi:hypothetical protein